ncbi:MAG: aminotransferase class I/II-fold pyridoxal phosphate-dependent enzyme [Alphaproteobacteria bacterium]|nr:aminotransferase class I/II-fold pyridoxal phosphate-dependent enzyme [Alphaproteobacteria bacterium]
MKIEPFALERNQSLYENTVRFNLSDSGVHPLSLRQVLAQDECEEILSLSQGYGQTNGSPELRRRIAAYYSGLDEHNILITNGSAEANFSVIWTLVEPGDDVLVMLPNYMLVWGALRAFGANAIGFQLREDRNWAPDLDELRDRHTPKTKLIVVCNPNNPTGAILERDAMEEIVACARKSGAYILSDEIYRGSEFSGTDCPSFLDLYEKAIVCSGLSKSMALPGLRIGWIAGPRDVIDGTWHRHDYTTISTSIIGQYVATKVLEPRRRAKILSHSRSHLRQNLAMFSQWLSQHSGTFDFTPPKAGGMAFVRYHLPIGSTALVERFRTERSVFAAAGDWFGMDHFLRFGIGTDANILRPGLELASQTIRELGG